jgi:hypothetical protein
MYAIAAGAAGVGVLALAKPAEARIIYTPANQLCPCKLDLNHGGTVDFIIHSHYFPFTHSMLVEAASGNAVVGTLTSMEPISWAAALKQGSRIGRSRRFFSHGSYGQAMAEVSYNSSGPGTWIRGPWVNVKNRYLGVRFQVRGKTHYGWARLTVHVGSGNGLPITATLTGYAYETIPNKPIIAGQEHGKDEATLGHLATGASAIPAWRVKPTAATSH